MIPVPTENGRNYKNLLITDKKIATWRRFIVTHYMKNSWFHTKIAEYFQNIITVISTAWIPKADMLLNVEWGAWLTIAQKNISYIKTEANTRPETKEITIAPQILMSTWTSDSLN